MGLRMVSSTAWGAQRLEELLESRRVRPVFSAGNGEVELYELDVPPAWEGRPLFELVDGIPCTVMSLTHAGRAALAGRGIALHAGDLIHVGASLDGAGQLRARLYGTEA